MLDLTDNTNYDKYNTYRAKITKYIWYQNQFGGYICRELIHEETLYDIMLGSTSAIAKTFRHDVSKILVQLRKSGKMSFTNEKVELKNDVTTIASQQTIAATTSLVPHQNTTNTTSLVPCQNTTDTTSLIPYKTSADISGSTKSSSTTWINIKQKYLKHGRACDMMTILSLVNRFKHQTVSQCFGRTALYAFLTNIRREHGRVVIKFGYTDDMATRWSSLKTELGTGTEIYLIAIKRIWNKKVEEDFHKMLKQKYPGSNDPIKIGQTVKTELYKFCLSMMDEFDSVKEDFSGEIQQARLTSDQQVLMEEIEKSKETAKRIFAIQADVESIIPHITDPETIKYYADVHYKFMDVHSKNQLEEMIKKMEFDKELGLKNKEKEMKIDEFLSNEKQKEMECKKEITIKELCLKEKELCLKEKEMEHKKEITIKELCLKEKDKDIELLKLEIELHKMKSTEAQKNDEVKTKNQIVKSSVPKSTKMIKK